MYPYKIIGDIDLYTILFALGIVAALAVYRICADKVQINARLYNLTLICALLAVFGGYFSSIAVQAIYNIPSRGVFVIDGDTGSTFAGGLVGGASVFIAVYFIAGRKLGAKKEFNKICDCAACAIPAAHSFGRIGCLMAGCCYGARTDAFYGIHMVNLGYKVVPTQLFEAIFLALLCTVMIIMLNKKKRALLGIYMMSYGIFRFFIEFLRDDYRGKLIVDFLSPSQIVSVLLLIGGAVFFAISSRRHKNA